MRVTISCHGKFHAFQLARQLARRGALDRLLTSDPRALTEKGIPFGRARVFPVSEAVRRVPSSIPLLDRVANWDRLKAQLHDRWAAGSLGKPDLVVAWSGAARRVLVAAHEQGAVTVLERGSTHIAHQDRVLREEFERYGQKGGVDPDTVRAELVEYAIADWIMVPSRFARMTFIQEGIPASKLLQVPYGSDTSLFKPGVKQDDVFRLVFVGGIVLRKGVPYLLEAVKRLNLPNSELVLVGPVEPEMQPILRQYEGHFKATGPLGKQEIAALLQQSSVFVFPSIEEGLSLALREALASGVPVIATPESGAEDSIVHGRDGFLVPRRDVDALCQRIEQLYRDHALLQEMSKQAAAHARQWTWDDYGSAVFAEYQRVLSTPHQ